MTVPRLAIALSVLTLGCTNTQLRHNTVIQASTLTDLQHQQVLNNLAAFACNPDAIPFHVTVHDGTAQITDNGSLASQVLSGASLTLGAQRTAVDQWSMTPVTDDITIRLLRVAYRRALYMAGDLYTDDDDLANDLAHELKKQSVAVDDLRTTEYSAETPKLGGGGPLQLTIHPAPSINYLSLFNNTKLSDSDKTLLRDEVRRQVETKGDVDAEKLQVLVWSLTRTPDWRQEDREAALEAALKDIRQQIAEVRVEGGEKGQPYQIGYSRQDILKYRTGFNSVVSANGQYIVFPWEHLGAGGAASGPTADVAGEQGGRRNLSFIRLPEAQVRLTLKNTSQYLERISGPIIADPFTASTPAVRFLATNPLTGRTQVIALSINAKMKSAGPDDRPDVEEKEAARFRRELCDVFGDDYVTLSGGPLAKGVPVTITLLGQVAYTPAKDRKFAPYPGEGDLDIEEEPRYLKVTPSAIELRRQVMDIEKDILEIKAGWLGVGSSKHDVPKDACYVARWRDCGQERYIWVCPGFRKEFEEFTIKILNFSSLVKNVQITGAAGVKYSPGTSGGFFPR